MLSRLLSFLRTILSPKPVRLAIVRRYMDANHNYVGELYMDDGHGSFGMIGVSLDSFTTMTEHLDIGMKPYTLDTANDFLAPMVSGRVRVGALDPVDNDSVRTMVAKLPKRKMTIVVQNGFIDELVREAVEPVKEPVQDPTI